MPQAEPTIVKEEKKQITIRLPANLINKLQQEADKKGISLNAVIIFQLEKNFQ